MELGSRMSSERYNPITGTPIPVHPTRPNTSAIFGGSPGAIEYMFIPPSATTRPTTPDTTEKRRSLSRESLRRSSTSTSEVRPDSDECSSISDLSECSGDAAERRERTRTNSGSFSKTRKPIKRSTSSRLPVSTLKPTVMKRANSFTRGTGSCAPRGQANDSRGSTMDQQETNSTSDVSNQSPRSGTGQTSKIPRKSSFRGAGSQIPQSSRTPLKRADVNSNVANRERPSKETAVSKRTAPADSKTNGIAKNTSSSQTSSESKEAPEPAIPKQSAVSSIPVKGGNKTQLTGIPRLTTARQDGGDSRGNGARKTIEQNQTLDKENESAMQGGKSLLKHEGTGDELRVTKNDVNKSKLPRKSNIPKSNIAKTSQQKTRKISSTEAETKAVKTSQIPKTQTASDNKTNASSARREPAEVVSTSNMLQRSDSGYGDTDSASSKEDASVTEPGNELSFSRENSKSKIPIKRGVAKSSRDVTTPDEKKPKADTTKPESTIEDGKVLLNSVRDEIGRDEEIRNNNEKDLETSTKTYESDAVCSENDKVEVHESKKAQNEKKSDKSSSDQNLKERLGTSEGVMTSQIESRGLGEEDKSRMTSDDVVQDINRVDSNGISGKILEKKLSTDLHKPEIQDGGSSNKNDHFARVNVSLDEKVLIDSEGKTDENTDTNNVGNKLKERISNQGRTTEMLSKKKSLETSENLVEEDNSKTVIQKDVKTAIDIEKQAPVNSEKSEQEVTERKPKQSPRKPPRLSKLLPQNDLENKQEVSTVETRPVDVLPTKEEGVAVMSSDDGTKHTGQRGVDVSKDVTPDQKLGQSEAGLTKKVDPSSTQGVTLMGGPLGKSEDTSLPRGVGKVGPSDEVGQKEEEVVKEQEEPPRRSDNCMQCRMEQSMLDGEDISKIQNDPGFRQYPTFISPRKSLVTCKHHAKQTNDMDIARDPPVVPMPSLADTTKPGLALKALNMSTREPSEKKANMEGIKSPMEEQSRMISPVLNNAEKPANKTSNGISRSESLKAPKNTVVYESRKFESKTLPKPKGNHSPLLALSRDKKFAQKPKASEDIRTALSLEWDDTGTELSPPDFSDDDEESGSKSDDLGDNISHTSVKLMNTNEALDKLKVIQSLIMKEAESRSRKGSEENAGKHAAGSKNPGNEIGGKYESTSNPVSPTLDNPRRKASSPTIWDKITDNTAISQDQTTELLNETLAKLKASPKLSSNSLAKRSLSSRSLPGSRQASKEQLLSDGERPVYVYTSNWMNTSGKNSRGSSLSLCSNNRSLPSSRQNLATGASGLKRSESAAGRMEKENGKRFEPKERKEYRLSDFDEINLSDDLNELRNQKAATPHQPPVAGEKDMEGGKPLRKSKRRSKKKSKNTAETMNNTPSYGASMDDLAEGKTQCQCGGGKCVIS